MAIDATTGRRPAQYSAAPSAPQHDIDWGRELVAGGRGARDALTFGAGEPLYAGALALADAAQGTPFKAAFDRRMAAEQAQDRFESTHYGGARAAGQVLGTGAQIAIFGPAEGLFASGARIADATPLIAREIGAIAGAGGATGVGGQGVSDLLSGRLSSFGDYLGAGVGGAASGLMAISGRASNAGAVDGIVTSLAQDVLNGRAVSIDRARAAATSGGLLGALGGVGGRMWADSLPGRITRDPRFGKSQLGEIFSRARTMARGDKTIPTPKTALKLPGGGHTFPDQRTFGGDIVESKFGLKARLSRRQKQASQQLPNYRVDHSLPQDVGAAFGAPASILGVRSTLSFSDPAGTDQLAAQPVQGGRR